MSIIFENAITFFIIIFIGYFFKAKHILDKEDGRKISKIVLNVTLPCALISSVSELEVGTTMLLLILAGICFNMLMLIIGYFMSTKREKEVKAAHMLNTSGYNIGNFAIPFAQYFYPGTGMSYISMFDIGNAFMGLGLTYSIASNVVNENEDFSIKVVIKNITLRLGNANTFLSMFIVGLLLEFKVDRSELKDVFNIIITRNIIAVLLAIIVWFCIPIPILPKKMLMICLFAPATSVAPIFSLQCGYKKNMPAMVGYMSMLVSIITMSALIVWFQV